MSSNEKLCQQLMQIALFDLWLSNEDRNANNANLMYDMVNDNIMAIDYGCCFNTATFDYPLQHYNMSNTTKFCIIYAVLSQETSERLNVGLLAFADGKVFYQYSERKLSALEKLLPAEAYSFYAKLLKTMDVSTLDSKRLDYLMRYSNNLFAISEIKDVQMPYSEDTTQWLYRNYVDHAA